MEQQLLSPYYSLPAKYKHTVAPSRTFPIASGTECAIDTPVMFNLNVAIGVNADGY